MKTFTKALSSALLMSLTSCIFPHAADIVPWEAPPAETPAPSVTDLGAQAMANCYIVNADGDYKFDARLRGCSDVPVGEAVVAGLLWESFGTAVVPRHGQLLQNVRLDNDGFVYFSVPADMKDGNAVIAVLDSGDKVLWSWHIWLCKGYDPEAMAQKYYNDAGIMMDRNLGATSAEIGSDGSLGLHYQWGRKDPFPSGETITSATQAATSVPWPEPVPFGSIDYSIHNPMSFMIAGPGPRDWYNREDEFLIENRWGPKKTMYDPCPPGWRVPEGGEKGVWSVALSQAHGYSDAAYWVSRSNGYNFGGRMGEDSTIWYPVTAYHVMNGGFIMGNGQYGLYWACNTPGYNADLGRVEDRAYDFYFYGTQSIQPSATALRAYGAAVRCRKDT